MKHAAPNTFLAMALSVSAQVPPSYAAAQLLPPAYAAPVPAAAQASPSSSPTMVPVSIETATPVIRANSTGGVPPSNATAIGTTTVEVVTALTTWCPSPTVLTTNGHTYSVEAPTTLTITDCPCTVTRSVPVSPEQTGASQAWVSSPVWSSPAWASAGNSSGPYPTGVPPAGGAGPSAGRTGVSAPFMNGASGSEVAWGILGLVGGAIGILL